MSNSAAQRARCPLGEHCPRLPTDPETVHAPPPDWLRDAVVALQGTLDARDAFRETNGETLIGIYVKKSNAVVVWKDKNGKLSQHFG